ncbi:hypothetical protein [Methylocystis sp. Sn-Cys]|uniref:hypothetical protein n=1 Tax=Methylocystis sp. Sn-Cys TaxID=1701263 RepID=UPI001924F00B|nr:hypothetical protein [Methylocystis sp. Sn-Cys]MBL1257765.1 hypothetical protein [Methylocystis sp. Sn-Cys]
MRRSADSSPNKCTIDPFLEEIVAIRLAEDFEPVADIRLGGGGLKGVIVQRGAIAVDEQAARLEDPHPMFVCSRQARDRRLIYWGRSSAQRSLDNG